MLFYVEFLSNCELIWSEKPFRRQADTEAGLASGRLGQIRPLAQVYGAILARVTANKVTASAERKNGAPNTPR